MVSALSDSGANQMDRSRHHIHQSSLAGDTALRCITWNGIDKPERVLAGGYDGRLMLVDTNDPFVPLIINRARGKIKGIIQEPGDSLTVGRYYGCLCLGKSYNHDALCGW